MSTGNGFNARLRAACAALSALALTQTVAIDAAAAGTWSQLPLETGNARAVRFAPSNPNTVYAATLSAGVFRSGDGGLTWTKTGLEAAYVDNANRAVASVVTLVVSPLNDNVVYALLDGGIGAVYKTIDGGATWSEARAAGGGENFTALAMAPGSPSTLYVGGIPGVLLKTSDGGATWSNANSGLPGSAWVRDIVVDPTNASIAYVAIVAMAGVYKTVDGGASWTLASTGIGAGTSRLLLDPATPATLFAVTGDGLYKSVDAAASWAASGSGLPSGVAAQLAIAPSAPSTLYASVDAAGIYRSTDGGGTWSVQATDLAVQQVSSLAVHPSSSTSLLGGTPRGPLRSNDSGATWTLHTSGFAAAWVQALTFHPSNPNLAYVGTTSGLFRTIDGGVSWLACADVPPGTEDIAIDPSTPAVVYAGGFGLYKSVNAGATWTATSLTGSIFGLGIDPSAPATLYAAGSAGLYKSTDAAASWTPLGGGLPAGVQLSVAVDPANSNVVYAGTDGNGVYKSTDGGASWADAWTPPNAGVYDVLFDPSAALYAGVTGIGRSVNGGAAWSFLSGSGGTPFDLSLDPTRPSELYVAKTTGFLRLDTASSTEVALDAGLTTRRGFAVAVAPDGLAVLGGTQSGLFVLQPNCGDGVVELGEVCDDGNLAAGDCCSPACDLAAANGTACNDGTFCNGADSCLAGACATHPGNPCLAGAACNTTCNEAADTCFDAAGSPCPDDGDPCTPPQCDGAGTCLQIDADSDGIGDLCDNCPTGANVDQANADCADPTYLIDFGCGAPPLDKAGCCDGGDLCDACPAQIDNAACDTVGTVAVSVGAAGGSATAGDGSTALAIPPGALADPTTITLTPNGPATSFALQDASVLSLSARPAGLQFLVPAQLTFAWQDRDGDHLIDRGRCLGLGSELDFDLPCDADADCISGDCSVDAAATDERELILKRDGQRFSAGGFDDGPFRCTDHLAGLCGAATADCSDAPGTGQATVAGCCDPDSNTWTFQTCSFSEFFLGLTAGDLVPGKGSAASDCIAEWSPSNPLNVPYLDKKGLPNTEQTCTDGDPTCDQDGLANGTCAFALGICLNVDDPRLRDRDANPACNSPGIAQVILKKPRPDAPKPTDAANGAALHAALAALAPSTTGGNHGEVVSYTLPLTAADRCTAPTTVSVPLKSNGASGKATIKLQSIATGAVKDSDKLKLICRPAAP